MKEKFKKMIFINLLLCIGVGACTVYFYIDKQNTLTKLQLNIPALEKELKEIKKENLRLQYEIDQFENPIHLMEMAQKPEFSHLKFPYLDKIIILNKDLNEGK